MIKSLKTILFLFIVVFLFSCERDKFKEYYERPSSLEPPVYQNLEARGNFTYYLRCVDKAGYKELLSKSGYMTVFAPNDSAFEAFLLSNNLTLDKLDSLANEIIAYSIIQDVYTVDKLNDYQSATDRELIPNMAFKRKTSYTKWVYSDSIHNRLRKVIDINGVDVSQYGIQFNVSDNNYRDIPIITSEFLALKGLTASDYNYFFPQVEFSGCNIADAKILQKNLWAENGIIHVTNKVIRPLPNLEEYLASNPKYSKFRNLINTYSKYFGSDVSLNQLYQQYTGTYDSVYVKLYYGLAYSLNCENFMRYGGGEKYDDQINGWTLIAPTNEAVDSFFNSKFLAHYNSPAEMPVSLIYEFINAHMFRSTVWPSKFPVTQNFLGEEARFDPQLNVIDRKMCSNGVFYGVDQVQKTDVFYTLLGDISLDPQYSMMYQALRDLQMESLIKNPDMKLQVVLINNTQMNNIGFNYNESENEWEYTQALPAAGESVYGTSNVLTALERILNLHIFLNKDIDFTKRGFVEAYSSSGFGDFVRYQYSAFTSATTLYGPGKLQGKNDPLIKLNNTCLNGKSYVIQSGSDPMTYNMDNVGVKIAANAGSTTSLFYEYYRYLTSTANMLQNPQPDPAPTVPATMNGFLYDIFTYAITDVKLTQNTTILIPSNTAIKAAVTAGYLPAVKTSYSQDELDKIKKFVNYHMLKKRIIVPDGTGGGMYDTYYSNVNGVISITAIPIPSVDPAKYYGKIEFQDAVGRSAYFNKSGTAATPVPVLSNRAVIIPIDDYLRYE